MVRGHFLWEKFETEEEGKAREGEKRDNMKGAHNRRLTSTLVSSSALLGERCNKILAKRMARARLVKRGTTLDDTLVKPSQIDQSTAVGMDGTG